MLRRERRRSAGSRICRRSWRHASRSSPSAGMLERPYPERPSREAAGGRTMKATAPIVIDPRLLEAANAVVEPEVPGATVFRRGKVRTVFEAGRDHFVIVASDRLSAYDAVLPTPIPGKGAILSCLSAFWMTSLSEAVPHPLVNDDPRSFPSPFREQAGRLAGRAQLVPRAERIPHRCGAGRHSPRRGGAGVGGA